ncbi:MAG: hypothetical protein EB120_04640 [Proteobacteria bacterium]|nr:hypothetical protein [Pseudomonadota bacterium]
MKNKGIRGFVTQVTPVSSALTKVTFRLSEGLKYQPGQSVWLEVTRSYGSAVASQRFALCGDPVQAIRTNSYEVTQPDEWIQGFWGKAISLLKSKKFQLDFSRARFFVSAGEGVSEEVVKMLTEEKGVRREQIAKDILHARLTSSQNQAGLWIPVELVTEEENEELLQQDYPEISRAA